MERYALFDIGGTALKYGVADAAGHFFEKGNVTNPAREGGVEEMLRLLEERLHAMREKYALAGIGASTAGVVDAERGVVDASENIPGYAGTNLKAFMEKAGGVPCAVENDVNCAGLGEAWIGAAKDIPSLVCVTLGTGVGASLIADGRILHGAANFAGEVGYLPLAGGTLEELASVSALVRRVAKEKGEDEAAMDGNAVFSWAKDGDSISVGAIDSMMRALAEGIWMIACVVNPAMVVIGGGITAEKAYLAPRLRRELSNIMLPRIFETTRISFAALGNDAGMLGALRCIMTRGGSA